ncbi:hypothetical protein LCGC14_2912420 [marine sediment metagenome]|uniref:Uncharacterized protein n=1 Tax=marine sediment metagenome TaxID=412755 RepID=A0A0F8XRK9_9ZZZZ
MMMIMARETNARSVLEKLLTQQGMQPEALADARRSDKLVDEALDGLEHEEPGLLEWLNSPEVNELLRVNNAAVYSLIRQDYGKQMPLEQTVYRVGALTYRVVCALTLAAAMRERDEAVRVGEGLR